MKGASGPNYTQMGIAALIPGMQHLAASIEEFMEKELGKMRAMLAAAQRAAVGSARDYLEEETLSRKPDGRGGYWQSMTPEERSAEGKRRAKKGRATKAKKARKARKAKTAEIEAPRHPSDPRHPGHDQWIANLRASQKKYWDSKSKAAKKAQINKKMQEAKAARRAERAA